MGVRGCAFSRGTRRKGARLVHDRLMAMDFYVGPAVLTLDGLTLGVTAWIDSSASRGLYVWGGYLDTHTEEVRLTAIQADRTLLALPGREALDIDVVYTTSGGIGFLGIGPSPLETPEHCEGT